jgi:hypothetical protein
MKAGLLTNPLSQQNRKKIERVRAVLPRLPGLAYGELSSIADVPSILRSFAADGVELVILNGGDGTVQAVMTSLINDRPFGALPALAILPMGMTNQIAHDVGVSVGLGGRVDRALLRLIRVAERGRLRRSVRHGLSLASGGERVHGMFFGNGAFYRGTMMARRKVHPLGVERTAAVGAALALLIGRAVVSSSSLGTLFAGETMTTTLDDGAPWRGEAMMVMATTLRYGIYGIYPFWGAGEEPLRVTRIPFPPERFGRAALPIIFGQGRPWFADNGYVSESGRRLHLQAYGPAMLDGETIETPPGTALTLEAGPEFTFVRP